MKKAILRRQTAVAGAMLLAGALLAAPVMAKTQTQHLRGTIKSVNDSGFTMKTESGHTRKVKIGASTKIAGVVSSSLDKVDENTFIGTANVKRDGQWQALEVVVFPQSMKGTGRGDYPWDLSPSQVSGGDQSETSQSSVTNGTVSSNESSMTNGTVESSNESSSSSEGAMNNGGSSMTNGTVKSSDESSSSSEGAMNNGGSSMTNGTVKKSNGQSSMTVKVDYGKGSKTIHIPQDVPVVALKKGSKRDLRSGAAVFVAGSSHKSSSAFHAKQVLVGINGTKPPM